MSSRFELVPSLDQQIAEAQQRLDELKAKKRDEEFVVAAKAAMENFQGRVQDGGLLDGVTLHYQTNGFRFSVSLT